jgi:Tfp pilus assembly protein PilF
MPSAQATVALTSRRGSTLAPLAIALAVVAAHGVGLRNGFVWDDGMIVVDNPDTREISRIGKVVLSPDLRPPYYRPLNRASYLVDYQVFGMEPAGFHAVNVALQVGCALALYFLALRLSLGLAGALAAGLLLAVHPVGVEAVAFVTARNNLFALLFSLTSLVAFARAEREDRTGPAVASGLLFLLALLSKEPAVMVLPVALAWVLLPGLRSRPPGAKAFRLLLPLLLALATYLVLRTISLGALVGSGRAEGALAGGLLHRLALNLLAVPRYAWLLLFPRNLTTYHVIPEVTGVTVALAAAAWAGILALVAVVVRWRSPAATVGLLWFLLGLLPIANLFSLPTATVIAERYIYIPAAGIWLVAGAAVDRLWRRERGRTAVAVAGLIVVAALGARTHARTLDWRDDLSLDRAAVAVSPGSAAARLNLGTSLLAAGDVAGAWREWREAARLDPNAPGPLAAMGLEAQREGDLALAENLLRRAVQVAPGHLEARLGLAALHDARGDAVSARQNWEAALRTEPRHVGALVQLGISWATGGDLPQGERYLRQALAVDPRSPEVLFNLGKLCEMSGRPAEAIGYYRRFLAGTNADPESARIARERIRLLEGTSR